jgi:hypothetical protein
MNKKNILFAAIMMALTMSSILPVTADSAAVERIYEQYENNSLNIFTAGDDINTLYAHISELALKRSNYKGVFSDPGLAFLGGVAAVGGFMYGGLQTFVMGLEACIIGEYKRHKHDGFFSKIEFFSKANAPIGSLKTFKDAVESDAAALTPATYKELKNIAAGRSIIAIILLIGSYKFGNYVFDKYIESCSDQTIDEQINYDQAIIAQLKQFKYDTGF